MRNISEEERKFLAAIQGTFNRKSKRTRIYTLSLSIGLGVGGPLLFLYAFFEHGLPHLPLTGDQWTLIACTALTIGMAVFMYLSQDIAYQFDGVRIVGMWGDREWKTIDIQDITAIGLALHPLTLRLQTPKQSMNILIAPDFAAAVRQMHEKSAETSASATARTKVVSFSGSYLWPGLEIVVQGTLLALIGFVISLFYNGRADDFLRSFCLYLVFLSLVMGVLRALLIFVMTYFRTKK